MGNHQDSVSSQWNKDTGFHPAGRGKHILISITCRELGVDCDFEAEGRNEYETLTVFMEHVQKDHTTDWFDLEDINMKARTILRHNAA